MPISPHFTVRHTLKPPNNQRNVIQWRDGDARDKAALAYDAAKRAARIQKAKRAHDDIIAATHRAQADALEIEAAAKRRLADEYDAAQDRGEVQGRGGDRVSKVPAQNVAPTAAEVGLDRKDIRDARQGRNTV